MEAQCTVGILDGSARHLKTYSKKCGIESLMVLDPIMRETLHWRTGTSIVNIDATICLHHKYVFLKRYPMLQKKCCDPFSSHTAGQRRKYLEK